MVTDVTMGPCAIEMSVHPPQQKQQTREHVARVRHAPTGI